MSKNDRLVRHIGVILARCMPGLGRALTGSMPLGLGLCLLYIYLMRGAILQQDRMAMLLLGAAIWSLFSSIDSATVRKTFEVERRESSITESVSDDDAANTALCRVLRNVQQLSWISRQLLFSV